MGFLKFVLFSPPANCERMPPNLTMKLFEFEVREPAPSFKKKVIYILYIIYIYNSNCLFEDVPTRQDIHGF